MPKIAEILSEEWEGQTVDIRGWIYRTRSSGSLVFIVLRDSTGIIQVTINKDDSAVVEGNLTIMGVTKPVKLNVEKISCGVHPFNKKDVCGFDATATIKRSDFGMKYGLPAIGDEITMYIEAEGVKK